MFSISQELTPKNIQLILFYCMIFARLSGRAFLWMGFRVLNKDLWWWWWTCSCSYTYHCYKQNNIVLSVFFGSWHVLVVLLARFYWFLGVGLIHLFENCSLLKLNDNLSLLFFHTEQLGWSRKVSKFDLQWSNVTHLLILCCLQFCRFGLSWLELVVLLGVWQTMKCFFFILFLV